MTDYAPITGGQANEAFQEKLFSRRSFLAAMPAPLLMPHVSNDFPTFTRNARPPYSPTVLPFVKDATEDERLSGVSPRCFWSIAPTGEHGRDCAIGAGYAGLALDYMVAARSPHLLQWSVFDMIANGRPHTGIEVGYLSVFGRIATNAHAHALQINGGAA